MSEAQLQSAVLEAAKLFGWRRAHFRTAYMPGRDRWVTAMSGEKGFVDLVLVRPPRLLMVELKAAKGRLTPEQTQWLDALGAVPCVEAYVWRPESWRDGTIAEALR